MRDTKARSKCETHKVVVVVRVELVTVVTGDDGVVAKVDLLRLGALPLLHARETLVRVGVALPRARGGVAVPVDRAVSQVHSGRGR